MRAVIALIPVLVALAACDRQAAPPPQPKAEKTARTGFDASQAGSEAPATPFAAPDGKAVNLTAFKGQRVLVNLWATWCGPCVKELPALDRLAARTKGTMVMLAVNQFDDPAKADAWWKAHGLKALAPYHDPDGKLSTALGSGTLPTTVLYDAQGREVWRVVGEMDWDSAAAQAALARASTPAASKT